MNKAKEPKIHQIIRHREEAEKAPTGLMYAQHYCGGEYTSPILNEALIELCEKNSRISEHINRIKEAYGGIIECVREANPDRKLTGGISFSVTLENDRRD